MSTLAVSSTLGLIAVGALALNAVFGFLVWSKTKLLVARRITAFKLHKWTGYTAALLVLLHVVLIPLDPASEFRWLDLLLPLWTRHQPFANTLGAVALWVLAVVVVTSYFQRELGFRRWRTLHYLAYAAFALFVTHGLVTDPELKDRAIDWVDAEKLFVEACALVIVGAGILRLRRARRIRLARGAGAASIVVALGFAAPHAHAEGSTVPPASGRRWMVDQDNGLVWQSGDLRWTSWGFAQGVLSNDTGPYWRRFRQGMSIELPRIGVVRPAAVYEVDLTDNNFFRSGPVWKVFENAFLAVQNADDASRFRVLYGQNTHPLSREDNLSSGNLPTVNRSIILESHGSVHAFGTQWGGQMQGRISDALTLVASAGDNTGSLNQENPHFGTLNDLASKATLLAWKGSSQETLLVEAALDYTRTIYDARFVLGTALGNVPLAAVSVGGHKVTGEMDVALNGGRAPVLFEVEWIVSSFSATRAVIHGGYAQALLQAYHSQSLGDLSLFVRPEFASIRAPGASDAALSALRVGLDWNVPGSRQRANALLEGAWHAVAGAPSVVMERRPAWEVRLMLRLSMTRHVRFGL